MPILPRPGFRTCGDEGQDAKRLRSSRDRMGLSTTMSGKFDKLDNFSDFDPWEDRKVACLRLLEALERGATRRQAAATAGVHVATVCRWKQISPFLNRMVSAAAGHGRRTRYDSRPKTRWRPNVPVHPECPVCGEAVEVRRAWNHPWGFAFWRCSCWPVCSWSSWRPRHPEDCSRCHGPRFWSCSRKSVSCLQCGVRITRH
jgi:hypothetical protein